MKTNSPYAFALALLLSFCIAIPADMLATPPAPQAAGSRAGEVSRVIPAVSIARGSKTLTASAKSVVDWQDLVNTQVNGRARIALDDGSVLNVGSQSSMHVVKHDAGTQQTELELTYGKLRSQAQKIAKPDGKFEVHTPAGVAGVVGTDFYVAYDNSTMNVIVFEGSVRVCDLAGLCVVVKPGQMTSVRSGNNSGPLPPAQATLDLLTEAVQSTDVGGPPGVGQATTVTAIGKGPIIIFGILVAIPAIVVPVATRKPRPTPVVTPPVTRCNPQAVTAACG
jgi:ferric-dicitrate binding protein FerR (iron transport regulator)